MKKTSSTFSPVQLFLQRWWFALACAVVIAAASFIRLYGLTKFPPSLYWEEAALGYDAFSILKTGKDHHGHPWPIVAFESFGDYKPSLYFYSLVPSIALFGLSDFAVRFPSAVSGILTVVAIGLLARECLGSRRPQLVQLLAMGLAAVNPWAIQFSRGGWEVNLATCFVAWGMWAGLTAARKWQPKMALIGSCLLTLSMYAYHATRVIVPFLLLALGLSWIWQRYQMLLVGNKKANWQQVLFKAAVPVVGLAIAAVILASPLVLSLGQSSTSHRFAETSLYSTNEFVLRSNELQDHFQPKWLGKILFHRYWFMAEATLANYLLHFRWDFLFVSGDANWRHSTQLFALFYPFEIIWLLLGVVFLVRNRSRWPTSGILAVWLLVGILPAAITQAAPHALRILPTMPVWIVLLTAGIMEGFVLLKRYTKAILGSFKFSPRISRAPFAKFFAISFAVLIMGTYIGSFGAYWDYFSKVYPVLSVSQWQYGYAQMIHTVESHNDHSTPIFMTREQGRPAMYYWFYTQTDPKLVQAANATVKKDQGEFLEFENLHFINTVNEVPQNQSVIVASSPEGRTEFEAAKRKVTLLNEIKDLTGKIVWQVYKLD
jgi:4-amino-4-deoxy-L-arabinose transferase-like glycosyltransferase